MFWLCFGASRFPGGGWADCAGGCSCPLGWATTDSGLRVLLECKWGLQLACGCGPSAFIGVCCFCISLSNAGVGVLWWYALVDVGVLVLRVFQSLVYAGCTQSFVGGGWSLWTRMFFGVVGVTTLGWALGLQCRHRTS